MVGGSQEDAQTTTARKSGIRLTAIRWNNPSVLVDVRQGSAHDFAPLRSAETWYRVCNAATGCDSFSSQ